MMKNNTVMTARTFFRMAEADRKLLVVTNALSTVFTASLVIKLLICAVCLISSKK